MAKKNIKKPTDRELEILQILWRKGPSSVREVNEEMSNRQKTGYTTTLKIMQIMVEKGILVRDDSQFKHVYTPSISEKTTQKRLVRDLLDRAFSGSADTLVMRALSAKKISQEELANIKKILDTLEKK